MARAAGAATAGRRRRIGLRFALRLALRVALRFGLAVGAFGVAGRFRGRGLAALEVGRVPAAALQLEAGRGDALDEPVGLARRAGGERRVADLLQRLELVAAGRAPVFVDRHGKPRSRRKKRLINKDNYNRTA